MDLYYSWISPIISGSSAGVAIGLLFTATKKEQEIRGTHIPPNEIDPFAIYPIMDVIKILLNSVIYMVLIVSVFLIVSLGMTYIMTGMAYFTREAKSIFGYSCLAGLCIGRFARYLYWKSRNLQ